MKKEYIILVVIIVLLGTYLIVKKNNLTHYSLPEIPELKDKDITKIVITRGGDSLTLKEGDSGWEIMPMAYPADETKVKNMIDIIDSLKLTTLVSESKNYARYDLNDNKKITVRAFRGETPVREFEIGKPAPSFRHTFVKLLSDDRIYYAQGNFRSRFDLTLDQIRDKTVMNFDQEDITEIRIEKDGNTLTAFKTGVLEEAESEGSEETRSGQSSSTRVIWKTEDEEILDNKKINDIISTLSNLRCEKYIEGREKTDFQKPIYTVTAVGSKPYKLSIYTKENENDINYPAVSSENGYPFFLSSWQAEKMMKSFKELKEKE